MYLISQLPRSISQQSLLQGNGLVSSPSPRNRWVMALSVGLGFGDWGLGFRKKSLGLGLRVWDLRCSVEGLVCMVER